MLALAAGPLRIGVRVSEPRLAEELRRRLEDVILDGIPAEEVPHNLSVLVGETNGSTQAKHQLFWQCRSVGSSASSEFLEDGIRQHLAAYGDPSHAVALCAMPLDVSSGVIAVDLRLRRALLGLEPSFRRRAWRVVPSSTVPMGPGAAPVLGLITPDRHGRDAWLAQLQWLAGHRLLRGEPLGGDDVTRFVSVTRHVPTRMMKTWTADELRDTIAELVAAGTDGAG